MVLEGEELVETAGATRAAPSRATGKSSGSRGWEANPFLL